MTRHRFLGDWLDLAGDSLAGLEATVDWNRTSALLRELLHAPLAGTFFWHADGVSRVHGYPEPEDYDLADVASRAPRLHPLARVYATTGIHDALPIHAAPSVPGPAAADYLAELSVCEIDQHLWIPLPAAGGWSRVCGVCRPVDPYTDGELSQAREVARVLSGLVLHADAMSRWRDGLDIGVGDADARARLKDAGLTPREVTVLSLCAEGRTLTNISRCLGLSPRTVDKHLENAYRKLRVRDRVSAVNRAVAGGLLRASRDPTGRLLPE